MGFEQGDRRQFQTTHTGKPKLEPSPISIPISAVRNILARLAVDHVRAEEICHLIEAIHGIGDLDTPEFHVLWDACQLAEIPQACADKSPQQLREWIERGYRTAAGRAMAHTARVVRHPIERYPQGDRVDGREVVLPPAVVRVRPDFRELAEGLLLLDSVDDDIRRSPGRTTNMGRG